MSSSHSRPLDLIPRTDRVGQFSKGLAGAHATGCPSPSASCEHPDLPELVDVMLEVFGPHLDCTRWSNYKRRCFSVLSSSSWLQSSLLIGRCSVGYKGNDGGGKTTNGPFRCETRRTNWSYLCHSYCSVSGRPPNELWWGTYRVWHHPQPQNDDPPIVPPYRNLTFQEFTVSTFILPCYRSSTNDVSTVPHTQLGSSALGVDGLRAPDVNRQVQQSREHG